MCPVFVFFFPPIRQNKKKGSSHWDFFFLPVRSDRSYACICRSGNIPSPNRFTPKKKKQKKKKKKGEGEDFCACVDRDRFQAY